MYRDQQAPELDKPLPPIHQLPLAPSTLDQEQAMSEADFLLPPHDLDFSHWAENKEIINFKI
jgi:hypothetical protein